MVSDSHTTDIISLYPEQVRALDYLRIKGTMAPRQRLKEQLAAAFVKLEGTVFDVPRAKRETRPCESAWSVHEILDHLVVTHERAVSELRDLIEGRRPAGEPIPPGLVSDAPFAATWDSLVERLRQVHRDFLDAVNGTDDGTALDVRAPIVMVVKVPGKDGKPTPISWTYELDWKAYGQAFRVHTLDHVEQIKRTLAELEVI
jgi:hypothetical protein